MNWFFTIIRVAGASFPGASSLVQLQSELDANAFSERVKRLEDPISCLDTDVPKFSKNLYLEMKKTNNNKLKFGDELYQKYSRPIAILEANGLIDCDSAIGRDSPVAIWVLNPTYVMYLCQLYEDPAKMELLIKQLEECPKGRWLGGKKLAEEIGVPIPVVSACFDIYEAKGYGMCSNEFGTVKYCGVA